MQLRICSFVGYTAVNGAAWELDGLQAGPCRIGAADGDTAAWLDVVRPHIQQRIGKQSNAFSVSFPFLCHRRFVHYSSALESNASLRI
jgi:hypothetical protein